MWRSSEYALALEELDEYERGFLDGLDLYAWWKDGVQYVGTTGRTRLDAARAFLLSQGKEAVVDVLYPRRNSDAA